MFRSLYAAATIAATSAVSVSQHGDNRGPSNLAQAHASIGATTENVETTDPLGAAFATIKNHKSELTDEVEKLNNFQASATDQLGNLTDDLAEARSDLLSSYSG